MGGASIYFSVPLKTALDTNWRGSDLRSES